MNIICKGINSKNLPCKKKARGCGYCIFHVNQRPIEFYPQLENWPDTITISNNAYRKHWLPGDLLYELREFKSRLVLTPWELKLPDEKILYSHRVCLISSIELIKLNVILCYGNEVFDKLIGAYAKKIENVQGMADYAEDFKKKCWKSYRDQAKKKLVTFYFNRVEGLCPDVIEKIMTFY
jgi:hypothetical protein